MSTKEQNLTSKNTLAFVSTIVQQLDVLYERRKEWEATDYKKATEGLYALLAECLNIFNERFVKASDDERIALRRSLVQRLSADNIRVVKTSTTLTMLARFVFNSDRKRAQGYSYVLAAAVSRGITAKDFAPWVMESGGLEEIKRLMVKSEEAKARQAAVDKAKVIVKEELELNTLQPLGHVNIAGLTGTYAVLLAKPNVDGGVDIIGAINQVNDPLVNALVMRMAKEMASKTLADVELGRQMAKEQSDLLASAHEQPLLMVANA